MIRRIHLLGGIAAVVIALCVLSGSALAAKGGAKPSGGGGGTSGSSSLSLVLLNSSDGLPHWGQQVTFNVSTTATSRPYVNLDCKQNGSVVYSNQVGYFADYPWVQYFNLSSSYWTGGDADCTAGLASWNGKRWSTITSISFHVAA